MFARFLAIVTELEKVADVYVSMREDGSMHIVFDDFEGFDARYNEVMREYAQPCLVEAVEALIEAYHTDYRSAVIEGHLVTFGYSSDEI